MGFVAMLARRTVARFIPGANATVRCSACQREKNASVQMIAGPSVYFCGDCVQRAARQLAPRRPAPDAVRCRFCRQLRSLSDVTHVEGVAICADCLGVMEQMLESVRQPRPGA
jgi:ClpX C4-type zinc finger protein